MGKAGKERKRLRTLREVNGCDECRSDDEIIKKLKPADSEDVIILGVLHALRKNMSFYLDKACKVLRVVLFPLIQIQQDLYFEIDDLDETGSESSGSLLDPILCEENISLTVQYISYLAANIEDFNSVDNKAIR